MKRNLMMSGRIWLGVAACITAAGWLFAQESQRQVSPVKTKMVVLRVVVTDGTARFINGLKPSDFLVFEDGILQTIHSFAEGSRPLLPVTDDGATRPLVEPKPAGPRKNELTENSYTITYYPAPSNHNEGFRKIHIEIVPDVNNRWRVRHKPGYQP